MWKGLDELDLDVVIVDGGGVVALDEMLRVGVFAAMGLVWLGSVWGLCVRCYEWCFI